MTSIRSARAWFLSTVVLVGLGGFRPDEGRAGADDAKETPAARAKAAQAAIDAEPVTWDGYVWIDAEQRVRIGTPLSAGQFMIDHARVVAEPLATALRPLASPVVDGDAFAFASALERPEPKAYEGLPHTLVRLRGRVTPSEEGRVRTLAARLVALERLSDSWVRAWRPLFAHEDSPWRASKDGARRTPTRRKAFLSHERAVLEALSRVEAVEDGARATAAKIDPQAVYFSKFRRGIEHDLVRTIAAEAKELGVAVTAPLLAAPPSPWSTLEWIVEAGTKVDFLARAAREWTGDAIDLEVSHYDGTADGTSRWHVVTDLETIRDTWSESGYAFRRRCTIDVRNVK